MPDLSPLRETRPATAAHLRDWVHAFTGVRVASAHVCVGHSPPLDWLSAMWLRRPDQSLVLGSRGSGKSFLSAVLTHLESRFNPGMGTRILGGSKSQSLQIFEALSQAVVDGAGPGGHDRHAIRRLLTDKAVYRNGSQVAILAASRTSVRGPHVASLRLDEVDEIDPDLRESSLGMCMSMRGVPAAVGLTSTWHRVGGPMAELVERGKNAEFPAWTTCTFDVLERCPPGRSGPYVGGDALYELCPGCALRPWCHSERDRNGGRALAKLAHGHYAIGSLIQKAKSVSRRTFDADYLCKGPKADGLWFTGWDESANVTPDAEYDPALPVHLSVDSGVFTGAVFFQTRTGPDGDRSVHVFADYLAEGRTAETAARELLALAGTHCGGRHEKVSTDTAGGARNPVGPSVLEEYRRVGLRGRFGLDCWPVGPVADSLALLEGLIRSADGTVSLTVHPRCKALITALANYRRAKRGGQWQDYPADPAHPHEDMIDALRGGLKVEMPEGRKLPNAALKPKHVSRLRY